MKVKKSPVFAFIALLFIIFLSVQVVSIGVAPGKVEINFVPGQSYEGSFDFSFMTRNPAAELEVSVEGDLSEYVEVNKNRLTGSETVKVFVKLPTYIEKPGPHRILIGAAEAPPEDNGRGGFGISVSTKINAVIQVNVPYPGKYGEIGEFEVKDANTREPLFYILRIYSRGNEQIITSSRIEIYDSKNKSVKTFNIGIDKILPADFVEINSKLDSGDLMAGNYKAVAIVSYDGKEVSREDNFKLGELRVKIVNYTRMLEKNKINPFEIEVESLWNDPIENLYAEVFVEGTDISFLTPTIELMPWQKEKLRGYFDTTEIKEDELYVKMVLHYGDKTTEETAYLKFVKKTNYLMIGSIIVGVVGLILLVVWIILRIKKSKRKDGKKK